ncbi:MAG: AAA family ATPase [Sulfurimonas sp.]|jgi:ABC-type lipoprotein export system ATPase subunit
MKIKYLEIKNYKQFKDLTLELTYPQGHEKAGAPLDKICIIGQSGTGKTNLLEIITKSTIDFSQQPKNDYLPFSAFTGENTDNGYITTKLITQNKVDAETLFTNKMSKITINLESNKIKEDNLSDDEKNYFVSTIRQSKFDEDGIEGEIDTSKMSTSDIALLNKLTNAKAELVLESINEDKTSHLQSALEIMRNSALLYGASLEPRKKTTSEKRQELNSAIKNIEEKYTPVSKSIKQLARNNFLDKHIVNINENYNSWGILKEKIDNYEEEKNNYTKYLFNKLLNEADYSKEASIQDMNTWEEKNENILAKIAEDINSIVKKFNLKLQMNEHTNSYDELIIQDLSNNQTIKYDELSTGTKNLLSTFIPLKTYAPKDSIILIDEPEMSFYPDIQRQLTDLYMKLGKNNQLVLATHSPLIASSFEPWEVVELKFDSNNQVYREQYYEGENHIDNYTLDPRLLTWTGILTNIFDLKEDSNFTFREKKLMEYASLKAEIKMIENNDEKEKKFKELMKLSKLLGLSN